jgi:hypothetical protein
MSVQVIMQTTSILAIGKLYPGSNVTFILKISPTVKTSAPQMRCKHDSLCRQKKPGLVWIGREWYASRRMNCRRFRPEDLRACPPA